VSPPSLDATKGLNAEAGCQEELNIMWLLWIIALGLLFVEPLVGVIACGFVGVIHAVSANRKMTERRENDVLAASMLEKGEVVELGQKLAKETVGNPLNLSPEVKETIVQRLQERNAAAQNMEKTAEEWGVRNKQMLAELGDRQKAYIKECEENRV
jgi:hypothetical protein